MQRSSKPPGPNTSCIVGAEPLPEPCSDGRAKSSRKSSSDRSSRTRSSICGDGASSSTDEYTRSLETIASATSDFSRFREVAAWRLPKISFPFARLPQRDVLTHGSAVSNDSTRYDQDIVTAE